MKNWKDKLLMIRTETKDKKRWIVFTIISDGAEEGEIYCPYETKKALSEQIKKL